MMNFPLLSLVIFLPIFALVLIVFIKGEESQVLLNARAVSLIGSICTFLLSLILWKNFDIDQSGFQFENKIEWMGVYNTFYHVGVDGVSIFLVLLTTFLFPLCILASWNTVKSRSKLFFGSFLAMEFFLLGTFSSLDMVLFYIFFEAVLIPMFLIIGFFGGENRIYASFKFFLYTFLGSILMLIGILYIGNQVGHFDISKLIDSPVNLSGAAAHMVWWALMFAFAVKMPMFPLHTWLPDAHVEAPTAASMVLAGILLKLGGYGLIRFNISIMPELSSYYSDVIIILSLVALVYASLIAFTQTDMKKLIAYSSIAHMGYVTIGIFCTSTLGITGAIVQMLSHGVISAALFFCVGALYEREHNRDITHYGGVVKSMPRFAAVFLVFIVASVGLPGTSGFIGEFFVILASFKISSVYGVFAALGMVLGPVYGLSLYRRVVLGKITNPSVSALKDLNMMEVGVAFSMVAVVIWIGVDSTRFTKPMSSSVSKILSSYNQEMKGEIK